MGSTTSMQKMPVRSKEEPAARLDTEMHQNYDPSPSSKDTDQTEPSVNDDARKLYNEFTHLRSEFDSISEFVEDLSKDPLLTTGKYSDAHRLNLLGFQSENDADRKRLGDYFAVKDASEVIHVSMGKLLEGLNVASMALLTPAVVMQHTQTVLKLSLLRTLVWNNTDASSYLAEKVCKSGMLKNFVEDLKHLKVDGVVSDDGDLDNVFESCISVLQNCSRNPATRPTLREYDTVTQLLPFLKCKSEEGVLQTLFTLANLVDESENRLLVADDTLFDVLLDFLKEATEDFEHRHLGFSVEELVDGMTGLAKNDSNKKILTEKGCVSILIPIMRDGSDEEKEHAVRCVLELAFDKENKRQFIVNEDLCAILNNMKISSPEKIRKTAERAIWVIHLDDKDHSPTPADTEGHKSGHVMISYNWSDQKTVMKIRDSLKQKGFLVWMDIDNMEGSTLQAMAEAVQNAVVVLVCMSERYKLSQNCRSEAEYAFSLEKRIVPLLMQKGYKPDGWLGIIKGAKLFFDFSGKYPYDQKISDLIKELGSKGRNENNQTKTLKDEPDGEVTIVPVERRPTEAASGQSPARWTHKDISNWLTKIGLQSKRTLQSLTGENLVFLRDISQRAPEFFFNYLRNDLCLTLDEMMKFTRAVDRL